MAFYYIESIRSIEYNTSGARYTFLVEKGMDYLTSAEYAEKWHKIRSRFKTF